MLFKSTCKVAGHGMLLKRLYTNYLLFYCSRLSNIYFILIVSLSENNNANYKANKRILNNIFKGRNFKKLNVLHDLRFERMGISILLSSRGFLKFCKVQFRSKLGADYKLPATNATDVV